MYQAHEKEIKIVQAIAHWKRETFILLGGKKVRTFKWFKEEKLLFRIPFYVWDNKLTIVKISIQSPRQFWVSSF